jgi:hypothetical protein
MSESLRAGPYFNESPELSATLHCSCGTEFSRADAMRLPKRRIWTSDGGTYASLAALGGSSAGGTIRARCPGCGSTQRYERSGTPVSF